MGKITKTAKSIDVIKQAFGKSKYAKTYELKNFEKKKKLTKFEKHAKSMYGENTYTFEMVKKK